MRNTPTAQKYAITGADEAKAYLDHPLLGFRLRECTQMVNAVNGRSIEDIFGYPDHLRNRRTYGETPAAAELAEL